MNTTISETIQTRFFFLFEQSVYPAEKHACQLFEIIIFKLKTVKTHFDHLFGLNFTSLR